MKMNRDAMLTYISKREWVIGSDLPEGWKWTGDKIENGGMLPITIMDYLAEVNSKVFLGA